MIGEIKLNRVRAALDESPWIVNLIQRPAIFLYQTAMAIGSYFQRDYSAISSGIGEEAYNLFREYGVSETRARKLVCQLQFSIPQKSPISSGSLARIVNHMTKHAEDILRNRDVFVIESDYSYRLIEGHEANSKPVNGFYRGHTSLGFDINDGNTSMGLDIENQPLVVQLEYEKRQELNARLDCLLSDYIIHPEESTGIHGLSKENIKKEIIEFDIDEKVRLTLIDYLTQKNKKHDIWTVMNFFYLRSEYSVNNMDNDYTIANHYGNHQVTMYKEPVLNHL
ncbi:hypothetical protein JXC34_01500 [Candidatus Woesearchaeota archaeon]|nr:hypothetical protein [Candidatus Woesearchaeota archaeon]